MSKNNVSRRDFVKVMAVFGSAMILPETLRGASLPPPQEIILLPSTAIDTAPKTFLWIDRVPITEQYDFQFQHYSPIEPPYRMGEYRGFADAVVPTQQRIRINITSKPETFSKFFKLGLTNSAVEIAFMLPGDILANIVDGYCSGLEQSFSRDHVDLMRAEFEVVNEPRQIAASLMPKYLAGKSV